MGKFAQPASVVTHVEVVCNVIIERRRVGVRARIPSHAKCNGSHARRGASRIIGRGYVVCYTAEVRRVIEVIRSIRFPLEKDQAPYYACVLDKRHLCAIERNNWRSDH